MNLEQFDTTNVKLSPLEQFLKAEHKHMLRYLKGIVRDCKASIRQDRSLYKEDPDSEPSIDIRLCVDKYETNSNPFSLCSPLEVRFDWTFRTGNSSYDERHSTFCAAGTIGLDTVAESLLVELLEGF